MEIIASVRDDFQGQSWLGNETVIQTFQSFLSGFYFARYAWALNRACCLNLHTWFELCFDLDLNFVFVLDLNVIIAQPIYFKKTLKNLKIVNIKNT